MLNRWLGLTLGGLMLLANTGVFVRDVLPGLLPDEPPPNDMQLLAPGDQRDVQVGIFDDDGRRLGTSWTRSQRKGAGDLVIINTTTVLGPLTFPTVRLPKLRFECELTMQVTENRVAEIEFGIYGADIPIKLKGEWVPTGEFPCMWTAGAQSGTILLDRGLPAMLGDVIRPFDRLPDLFVGQTWQVKLVDPLKCLLPSMGDAAVAFEPVMIRVTAERAIEYRGKSVQTFVVEGGGATAYVAADGRVLRQEVTLPLLGKLVLLDEVYDAEARSRAIISTR